VTYELIEVEHDGPIAVVTLARPEKRNALSSDLITQLTACP